ncbi:MAG: pyridoxal kinase [Pseudomonadota bacterium]
MARIVVISSWVGFGHVGLSAAQPAIQALGHEVLGLPTVVLSNHPGWPKVAGRHCAPDDLAAMLEAQAANGWLEDVTAVLTGYLPTPAHIAFACDAITRVRAHSPGCRIVLDPVLGDAPKGLYLPEAAAAALRKVLLSRADVLTPNAFELGWLSQGSTASLGAAQETAARLFETCDVRAIYVTSAPVSPTETGVLAVTHTGTELYQVPKRAGVPNGPGDVFSALIATGQAPGQALGRLDALISSSLGAPHLRIAETAALWTKAPSVTASQIGR